MVSVDDDVYVAPDAIAELVRAYDRGSGLRVVAGSVDWGDWASEPLAMRWIGFPRKARPDQEVEILISALVLYPAELARQCPWNERLWPYDDLWVSLAWRMQGATLVCAAGATAKHDATHSVYRPEHAADHIYTNLFDALIVRRSILRLLSYETFGLLAGVKHWVRSLPSALGFSRAWIHGHRAFVSDLSALRGLSRGRE